MLRLPRSCVEGRGDAARSLPRCSRGGLPAIAFGSPAGPVTSGRSRQVRYSRRLRPPRGSHSVGSSGLVPRSGAGRGCRAWPRHGAHVARQRAGWLSLADSDRVRATAPLAAKPPDRRPSHGQLNMIVGPDSSASTSRRWTGTTGTGLRRRSRSGMARVRSCETPRAGTPGGKFIAGWMAAPAGIGRLQPLGTLAAAPVAQVPDAGSGEPRPGRAPASS